MKTARFKNAALMGLALASGPLFFQDAQACMASHDPRVNYFISYEKPHAGLFADGVAIRDVHPTIVDQCQDSAGQFLMVSLALRTQKANGMTADINLDTHYRDDSCTILNNPFPTSLSYDDKNKVFQNQYQILRSCAYLDIVEIDGNPIGLPDSQPASQVSVLSPDHIRVTGDFAYLMINSNSRFAIGMGLNQNCTQLSQIKALGLQPGDVSALLNTYIAGDASGMTTDVTPIGSTRIRLAMTAGSDLMGVSSLKDPEDVPSWPTIYKTNVEFGSVSVATQVDGSTKIDLIPIVDNTTPLKCSASGLCSSENSFQQPVSGLVELIDLSGNGRKVVDSWYFGASAPAQYQGLLTSVSRYVDPGLVVPGKRYAIEMTMADPHEDFTLFRNGLTQMLVDLTNTGTVAGLDSTGSIGGVSTLPGMGSFNGLGDVSPDTSNPMGDELDQLDGFQGPQSWPPYFNQTCTGGACFAVGKYKFSKKIGAEFTIGDVQPDQSYSLSGVKIYTADPVNGYKVRTNPAFPRISCTPRLWW